MSVTSNIKRKFTRSYIQESQLNQTDIADFDKLVLAAEQKIKEGAIVTGTVTNIINSVVIVDVGLKSEGRIPLTEFRLETDSPDPQIGDQVEIYIDKLEDNHGRIILSRSKAIRERAWKEIEIKAKNNEFVRGTICYVTKGGFVVDLQGVWAFLPGSLVGLRPIDTSTADSLIGIPQMFKILNMDTKLGNIVVSRKAVLDEQRSEAKKDFLNKVVEGETVLEGVIKNITDYGAFVDLGSIDALLHITDISWKKIHHPLEVLEIGQKVQVKVIKFDREGLRLHVGMKQLTDSPWTKLAQEFPVGKIMSAKISNVTEYGAFIPLKEGVEGLVHITEVSWSKNLQNPLKVLKAGQEVEFIVKEIDIEKHKVSLSIKRCRENPWIAFAQAHKVGEIITTKIRNINDSGIFVALGDEIDGIIYPSDISWNIQANEALKDYAKDQEIECRITLVDADKEQVRLSIKHLQQDPYEQLLNQNSVECSITNVRDDLLEVRIGENLKGIIKKADLSLDRSEQKTSRFSSGQLAKAKPLNYDKSNDVLYLSIKALELEEQEQAIKTYGTAENATTNLLDASKRNERH